jgi:hypothetical protein
MLRRRRRLRGLFQKYFFMLFLAVVVPLATNGISEAWLDNRSGAEHACLGSMHDERSGRLHYDAVMILQS